MKVVFMSLTGNVRQFVKSLNLDETETIEIDEALFSTKGIPSLQGEKYILIVPTYDEYMTECIRDFIDENKAENCLGTIGSGNLNFDSLYLFTIKDLKRDYSIPILYGFEYFGNKDDVDAVKQIIQNLKTGGTVIEKIL